MNDRCQSPDSGHSHQSHHSGGHSHGHSHTHGLARAGARHRGRLAAAFAILFVFMVVELVVGLATGSLALLSDAGHMVTDVAGLGMALAAIGLADRHAAGEAAARPGRTFGLYRLEILAALANAVLLFGVAGYVMVEAVRRFGDAPEINSGPMLVAAVFGLVANLVAFALLRDGSKESINVEGAYLEVLADTVGSVGVIVGALVMRATGWTWVDPAVGVAIGLWVVPRTWRLAGQALRILIQAAPQDLDLDALARDLGGIGGVVDVHDLHVWTLTSEMDVASAHLMISNGQDAHAVLDGARTLLQERYGIAHATLQVEPEDHKGCDDVTW
ncbi:MAG: cation transporter [Acidimicrobiales bacterium]|nr:cation transporter [Acidimicrobiales bacterium]